MIDESTGSIPKTVIETHYGHIRNKERQYILGEIGWRRARRDQSVDSIQFRKFTPSEEVLFEKLNGSRVKSYSVNEDNWYEEQVLMGDYVLKSVGRDGLPTGYLSFGLINNGDAFIIQVQGRKGRHFTPQLRNELVQKSLQFFRGAHVKRVFLINGQILNAMRKTPNVHLEEVYAKVAEENGFQEKMWGLPYIDLEENQFSESNPTR